MKYDLTEMGIIGQSTVMQELASWMQAAAPHWDTILITGERGTGKELLARAIHHLGPTRKAHMVVVDCASLHPATVESALFGHERGAFTGADQRRIGYLESAQNGTVFLDEIGILPLEIQGRLLRFLEERTITRMGCATSIHVHTRIVAATNRNLARDSQSGTFLPDLYDRLNILHLHCPPLRDRKEDIPLLLAHFFREDSSNRFTADALRFINDHPFPGNIRELRNLCRRLAIFHPKGLIRKSMIEQLLDSR